MMPHPFRTAGLLLLFQSVMTLAMAANAENRSVDNLLVQAGIHEQIRQFPDAMAFKIAQIRDLGQCDEHSFTAISDSIKQTINRDAMHKIVRDDVSQAVSSDQLGQLGAWYASPAGRKISAAEQAASTPEAYDAIRQQGELLFANQRKLALVKKIDATLHATDWAVNVELQSTIAMLGGLAQVQNKDITASLVQFASQLDEQKALLRPQVEKSVLLWYMYAYRDISNRDLEGYLAFLQEDSSHHFNTVALKSLSHAITVVVEDFILHIAAKANPSD